MYISPTLQQKLKFLMADRRQADADELTRMYMYSTRINILPTLLLILLCNTLSFYRYVGDHWLTPVQSPDHAHC